MLVHPQKVLHTESGKAFPVVVEFCAFRGRRILGKFLFNREQTWTISQRLRELIGRLVLPHSELFQRAGLGVNQETAPRMTRISAY